jgi:hypothetical protein
MIRHGLVAQEADLLCGRIPPSIFVKHYFSPAIRRLKDRTLRAVEEMDTTGKPELPVNMSSKGLQ